jgi:hypothetical protein
MTTIDRVSSFTIFYQNVNIGIPWIVHHPVVRIDISVKIFSTACALIFFSRGNG